MKHRAPRALASAVTAALLAVLIVAGGPTGPATAAGEILVSSGVPVGPVSYLPSTVTGATAGASGGAIANRTAYLTYAMVRSPEFWNAYAAQQAGTATSQQLAVIQSSPKPAIAATKLAPLTKVAGGAAAAFSSYQFGAMMTAGVLELVGTDANDQVCGFRATDGGLLGEAVALAAGQDCSNFAGGKTYVANSDGVGGYDGGTVCYTTGQCVTLKATVRETIDANRTWSKHCFSTTAAPGFFQSGYGPNVEIWLTGDDLAKPGSRVGSDPIAGRPLLQQCQTTGAEYAVPTLDNGPVRDLIKWSLYGPGTTTTTATPGTAAANPTRRLECVVDAAGQTFSATGAPYTESDPVWKPPTCPQLPPGVTPDSIKIVEHGGKAPAEVMTQETTPEYRAQQALAPECSNGTCLLDLRKGDQSCFQSPESCADWFTDPNKSSAYKCRYGSHDVALSECTVYAPTFKPEAKTSNAPLGNPSTGQPITNPNPTPGVGTSINPATGKPDNCLANGWATAPNPIEWVMVPVKCAIQWAFVPRPEIISGKLDTIKKSWQATTPGAVVTAMSGFALTAPASSCAGITVPMGWLMGIPDMKVFNACPGELMAPIAGVSKLVFYVIFTVVGIGGVTSNVGRIFGYRGVGAE